jgi:CSLREA domain-containing protein
MTKRRHRTLLGICIAAACSLALAPAAMADFVVNNFGDGDDAEFGVTTLDGTCDTVAGPPEVCTLRAAIEEANATPAADTITFGVTGLHPTGSQLLVNTPMTIDGNGSGVGGTVIDGNDGHRIFLVISGASPSVTFKDLRLQNGHVTLPDLGGGSAINSAAPLTLTNATVTSNDVTGTGPGSGAIAVSATSGTVSVTDSTVSDNTISSSGNNSGAGIDTTGGQAALTLTRTTVSGNSITAGTSTAAGGIAAGDSTGNPDLTITASTISGNSLNSGTSFGTLGGGIVAVGAGTQTIVNSTVSGNTAGSGGSGEAGGAAISGNGAITNSTFTGNAASVDGSDLVAGSPGIVTLKNTILGSAGACSSSGGSFLSATPGNNIVEDTSCGLGTTQGNRQNTDAHLGALTLNAPGTTKTHALLTGSPAIDTATADCGGLSSDQRGVSRPQPTGGACDVGAFELKQSTPPPPGGGGESTTPPTPTSPAPATTKKKCKKKKKKHSRAAVAAKKCKKRK